MKDRGFLFMNEAAPKFVQIDSLRGIAALLVILVHANSFGDVEHFPAFLGKFISQGARGVQLFYIISAFTLFYTFDLRKQDPHLFRNFLIRRFSRIAPLYYLAIVGYLVLRFYGWAWKEVPFPSFWNVMSNLLFLHGFSPFWINDVVPGGWSVGVEFPFYMILPILYYRIKSMSDALQYLIGFIWVALLIPLVMIQIKGVGSYDQWILFITQCLPHQMPHFGFGIVLYFLLIKKEHFHNKHYPLLFHLIFLYFGFATISLYYLNYDWPLLHVVLSFWFSLGFSFMIYLVFTEEKKRLSGTIPRYLGKISYGLYLSHFAGYFIIGRFLGYDPVSGHSGFYSFLNFGIRFLLCLAFSVVIASILRHVVEKPCQKWIRKKFLLS